jgi:hypothetical protein
MIKLGAILCVEDAEPNKIFGNTIKDPATAKQRERRQQGYEEPSGISDRLFSNFITHSWMLDIVGA